MMNDITAKLDACGPGADSKIGKVSLETDVSANVETIENTYF